MLKKAQHSLNCQD